MARSVGACEKRRRQPDRGRDGNRGHERDVGRHGMAGLARSKEAERHQERARHRRDLAPGVDAPPEPPQQIDQPGAGADRENQVEALARRLERERQERRADHEQRRHEPPDEDVVALGRARTQESPIEVVHEVRRPPVQVRLDRRTVRGEHAGEHQAEEAGGQEAQHRGIRHVVADEIRLDVAERPGGCRRGPDRRESTPAPRGSRATGARRSASR